MPDRQGRARGKQAEPWGEGSTYTHKDIARTCRYVEGEWVIASEPYKGETCTLRHKPLGTRNVTEQARITTLWDALGVDEGGLPVHLPIPVDLEGSGPVEPSEAHHIICWCNKNCPLNQALTASYQYGRKASDA